MSPHGPIQLISSSHGHDRYYTATYLTPPALHSTWIPLNLLCRCYLVPYSLYQGPISPIMAPIWHLMAQYNLFMASQLVLSLSNSPTSSKQDFLAVPPNLHSSHQHQHWVNIAEYHPFRTFLVFPPMLHLPLSLNIGSIQHHIPSIEVPSCISPQPVLPLSINTGGISLPSRQYSCLQSIFMVSHLTNRAQYTSISG